jgi:hypothetical protein
MPRAKSNSSTSTSTSTSITGSTNKKDKSSHNNDDNNNNNDDHNPKLNKWNKNGYGQRINPSMGKFTPEESRLVKEAIGKYCKSNNITSARLCSEADNRTDNLRGAWMEISRVLKTRTVQSIYRHGLRLMHPFKRGVWTDAETEQLTLLVLKFGKKWAEIQRRLNRSADSCRDKYREIDNDYTRGKWSDEESKLLEKFVREYVRVGDEVDMIEVGKITVGQNIALPWDVISKKMTTRSRLSCFKRFQILTNTCPRRNRARPVRVGHVSAAATTTVAASVPVSANSATNTESSSSRKRSIISSSSSRKSSRKNNTTKKSMEFPITDDDDIDDENIADLNDTEESLIVNPTILDDLPIPSTSASTTTSINTRSRAARNRRNSTSAAVDTVAMAVAAASSLTHISMSTPNPIHPDTNTATKAAVMNTDTIPINNSVGNDDHDSNLINALASSTYVKSDDVEWNKISYPSGAKHAKERWDFLLDQYLEKLDLDDSEIDEFCDLPVWEIARFMVGVVKDEEQAEIAARTVEAVFSL